MSQQRRGGGRAGRPGTTSESVPRLRRGSRGTTNPNGFNNSATSIGGVLLSVTGRQGRYAMPGFGHPGIQGMPDAPPTGLGTKRPPVLTNQGLARQIGNILPSQKRPRLAPPARYGPPSQDYLPPPGRGITPSYLVEAVSQAEQAIDEATPSDMVFDFDAISRQVHMDRGNYAYAQFLFGQVVFNHKSGFREDPARTRVPLRGRTSGRDLPLRYGGRYRVSAGTYRLLSLPALNYSLRLDDYYRPEAGGWMTPRDVLKAYGFDGIVRQDPKENEHAAFRDSNTLVYTVTVDKRDGDVRNIWGNVRVMQNLWLMVTRLPPNKVPQEYILEPKDGHRRVVPPRTDGSIYHPNPIQVIPWTSSDEDIPSTADLSYIDATIPVQRQGIAIKVGWVLEASTVSNKVAVKSSWYNASVLRDLPRVDMNMSARTVYY